MIKKIDKITALLFIFLISLISLFSYYIYIKNHLEHYLTIREKVIKLELLDSKFKNFSSLINKFSNYDNINSSLNEFQKIVISLENGLPKDFLPIMQAINKEFLEKKEHMEKFKSLNSLLMSATHLLFDIHQSLNDKKIDAKIKSLINEVLFYILKFIDSDYINKEIILKKLEELKNFSKNKENGSLKNFIRSSLITLEILSKIKKEVKNINDSTLKKYIKELNSKLDKKHNEHMKLDHRITILFFISSIIILIIFIILHKKSLTIQKSLYAFKYAVEHSDNSIVITDSQKNITFVNDTFEKVTGYKKEEILGKNPRILKSDLQDPSIYKELNEKLDKGKKWEGVFINKRKDGTIFYEKASIVPIFYDKKLSGFLAIKLDITNFIEQNKKLKLAATIFENTEEAIIVANKKLKIDLVNRAFLKIYGYDLKNIEGKDLSFIFKNSRDIDFNNIIKLVQKIGTWQGKISNRSKSGEIIPFWTTIKKIEDKENNIFNYIIIQTDLREIEKSRAEIDYLAYHDPLTGFNNRIYLEEYLDHTITVAKRNKTSFALLFLDLDRFKYINDTYGHNIGDKVLIEIANRLKQSVRESDLIVRWGGDEFIIILENIHSPIDVVKIVKKIISNIKKPIYVNSFQFIITASIGITLFPENGEDKNTLIKNADSAMYLAKEDGKNSFKFYTKELSTKIKEKLQIDTALHNGIKNKEFYMVFQPQYSLKNKKIVSIEALARWNSKDLGNVSPAKFIPIAEENGSIIELGYFIFEESCKEFKKIRENGVDIKRVAINVSTIQLKDQNLLKNFLSITKKLNISPENIEIEITESSLIDNKDQNIFLLKKFQKYGFGITIDDFGTGYSSMQYLKELPIDTIKIDKTFIKNIEQGSKNSAIVEAIIALGKALGYKIVAEGIETKIEEEFLSLKNCDLAQGYLFSKPITSDEIIAKFS